MSSVYSLKPSQSALLKFTKVLFGADTFFICVEREMWIGRWSELSDVLTAQLQAGSRVEVAMVRSGAELEFAVTRVAVSSFTMPYIVSPIQSQICLPLASAVSSECQRW